MSAAWLLPALAWAQDAEHAEHAEHGWDSTALLASFVNFAILVAIFIMLFRKSVTAGLKKRRAEVELALTEAATVKAEAEAKHKEYSQRLASLDSELAQIKADMLEAGRKERDRIVSEAEQKAARLRNETQFLIEQYAKQLRIDLTREAVEEAIFAAEQLLTKSTTAFDQQRLAQEYLAGFDKNRGTSPSTPPKAAHAEGRV
jgi:F-type H+-transporting ATPase subunit b